MKKLFCILLALSALLSCRRTPTYNGSVTEIIADTEPTPVLVSIGTAGKLTPKVATRGSGAVDEENMWLWKNEKIHVYAFSREAASFAVHSNEDPASCLLDGVRDGRQNGGKLAYVSGGEPYVDWSQDGDMYPKGIKPYHFYAYYLDDYEADDSQIVRSADSIVVPVEIDGSRDIMSARSHIEDHQLEGRGYTAEEKNILKNHAFCAYTANNDMHPELFFHHHLVRLSFEAYAGRKQGGNMLIKEIYVESPTKGDFTVAHKDTSKIGIDFSKDSGRVPFALKEKDFQTPLRNDFYKVIWREGFENISLYEREKIIVGGSLLVGPAASYKCRLIMEEHVNEDTVYDWDTTVDLTSASGFFEGGNQYVIRLALYGSPEVEVSASIVPWEYGGSVDLEEDAILPNV